VNALLDRPYHPPLPLRSGQLQTFLASSLWRAWGPNAMQAAARAEIVATDAGVRLLGFRSRRPAAHPTGLVILLHGWEGSADSTYMRCTGRALYQRGYDVFRLNLRDHGPSHHLNPGIFFAVRVEEVFDSVSQLCLAAHPMPVFLVGFSLGANFALRIALGCRHRPLLNLRHVVAVSPVLDPQESTRRADRHPVIRRYFMRKWCRSLLRKQQLFPDLYEFSEVVRSGTICRATDLILKKYSTFADARSYFKAYTLTGATLKDLPLPATLMTSMDDPIIPVRDFHELQLNSDTRVIIHRYGGHNGFLEGWSLRSRYETGLADLFDGLADKAHRAEA
jgi:uncharacterized protein